MIYLYTGSNGSGKTLNAIKFICEVLIPAGIAQYGERPVFYYSPENQPLGIAEAGVLNWEQITAERARQWWDFPDGSIFFLDEFRHVFPWRDHKVKTPEYVDRLAEHRSRGFDFVLSAQKPASQFDPAIQGFIEEHRHLVGDAGSKRSRHYVYQAFCSTPINPPKLQTPEKSLVSFDKKYFSYYRSASIHTHVSRKKYGKLWLFFGLLLALPVMAYIAFQSLPGTDSAIGFSDVDGSIDPSSETVFTSSSSSGMSLDQYTAYYQPRVAGFPHTAPAYDELSKPVVAPKTAACVHFIEDNACRCWTQQATPISIDHEVCLSIVKSGWFDHTRPSQQQIASADDDGIGGYRGGRAQSDRRSQRRAPELEINDPAPSAILIPSGEYLNPRGLSSR